MEHDNKHLKNMEKSQEKKKYFSVCLLALKRSGVFKQNIFPEHIWGMESPVSNPGEECKAWNQSALLCACRNTAGWNIPSFATRLCKRMITTFVFSSSTCSKRLVTFNEMLQLQSTSRETLQQATTYWNSWTHSASDRETLHLLPSVSGPPFWIAYVQKTYCFC